MRLVRLTGTALGVQWLMAQLRRPELMVFQPAVTLAAFWLGGERVLILAALGTPLIFAFAGAFRFAEPATPDAGGQDGMALRPQVVAILDTALRDFGQTDRLSGGAIR